jgi:uncharacterized protein
MNVSETIRTARTDAGLSQVELAARAGTSQPTLARYESGGSLPTLPTLERLLAACGHALEVRAVRSSKPARPVTSVRGQLDPRAVLLRRNRHRLLAAARACGVRRVRVFGSLARGTAGPQSDIDLLVDLMPGRTLLDLAAFRRQASEILGTPVDVATLDILKDRIRGEAEDEAVPL